MKRIILPLLLLLIVPAANTDTKEQTDWSGGPGEYGPDINFGNEFYLSSDVDWCSIGDLSLSTCIRNLVENNLDGASSVYSADLDGDGDTDVMATGYFDDAVIWWENTDGVGTTWTEHAINLNYDGATCICSEDINGDGDMDVIAAALWDDAVTLWLNANGSGTSWTAVSIDGSFNHAQFVSTGDMNDDGHVDILGAAFFGSIVWWENLDGSGLAWSKHYVGASLPQALCIQPGDIDGDGDADALGCNRGLQGGVRWWENLDGTGTLWSMHEVDLDFGIPYEVFPVDINGDDHCDVLGVSLTADLTWWENLDGLGTSWAKHNIDQTLNVPTSTYPADLDQDGDDDVIVSDDNQVTWWENADGSGSVWIEHPLTQESGDCRSVYSDDINGDDSPDVLAAGFDANDIYWFELIDYPPIGELESSVLYLGNDPGWSDIDWTATLPAGTAVSFLVRASDIYSSMGAWSDTIYSPGSLAGILDDYDSFFQYKVILESSLSDSLTPVLHDVTLSWTPVSITDVTEPVPSTTGLLGVNPNPAVQTPVLDFRLSEPAVVQILVCDLSGRVVINLTDAGYPAGNHSIQLDDIPPGIYFCRMITGDYCTGQRFVVIE